MNPLPPEDLQAIVDAVDWSSLRDARIILTGGTGFVGRWLVESFALANQQKGLKATMLIVSRKSVLHDDPTIHNTRADILRPLAGGRFTHAIHAACPSCANPPVDDLTMFNTIVNGTQNVLRWCLESGAKRVLYISSGAAEHRPDSPYGAAKKAAEVLCRIYAQQYGMEIPIARPYALIGPGLPLDAHFAIGNFIRDALAGGPVKVVGGTNVYRSYLYASDMAAWLWTLLLKGESCTTVNVGSSEPITIWGLARTVGEVLDCGFASEPGSAAGHTYVPVMWRTNMLGLQQTVWLRDAILKTARWHGWGG